MDNGLKAFWTILIMFCLGFIGVVYYFIDRDKGLYKTYSYSGTIISKGYEEPTSGYKSSSSARYYVIMLEDVSSKHIRVDVNIPIYYSLNVGDKAGFVLSNLFLYRCGNTNNQFLNLYEQ